MNSSYRIPSSTRLLRAIFRPLFRALFYVLARVRISGLESIPDKGPYIIAINHVSLYEAPFVLAFWPVAPEAAGAVDIWKRSGQSVLVRIYGGIPVKRGQYDRKLIDILLSVLRSGRPLLIAPEGGRSHAPGMRRALPGVAYLMEKAGVPVIPVGVLGAKDDFLRRALKGERPAIEMRIGKALCLAADPNLNMAGRPEERHAARQASADRIMLQIAALLPSEYRGVYGETTQASPETG